MIGKKEIDSKPMPRSDEVPEKYWGTWEDKNSGPTKGPDFWGSWESAERLRREQFLRRTPAQRLRWLEEMLALKYRRDSGNLIVSTDSDDPK
jgi:hypothetical protein